jgi:excisionase family DNA binding protein
VKGIISQPLQAGQSGATAAETRGIPAVPSSLSPSTYLHKDELAIHLKVSKRTVDNWMKRHVIPYIKVGRTILFRPADVDRALQRFTIRAVGEERTA